MSSKVSKRGKFHLLNFGPTSITTNQKRSYKQTPPKKKIPLKDYVWKEKLSRSEERGEGQETIKWNRKILLKCKGTKEENLGGKISCGQNRIWTPPKIQSFAVKAGLNPTTPKGEQLPTQVMPPDQFSTILWLGTEGWKC